MAYHPRENWSPAHRKRVYTRRDFIQRAALLGIAVPALPSLLAACAERDAEGGAELALGTPASPVQQPLFEDNPAIESGLPDEEGPLQLYNWADYINQDAVVAAQDALGVEIEITTFFNEEEAIQKLASGEVQFDVWFPTSQVVPKSVAGKLLQPLNLDYIPNLEQYVWPVLANPYYDQGSRYSVPYVLYSTGIAWRIDQVDSTDIEGQTNAWEVFWNEKYAGITGLYDSYSDAIAMALFRNGIGDPSAASEAEVAAAADSLIELTELMNIRYTIDGAYVQIPEGRMGLHQAWSGDIINSQYYFPEGSDPSVIRYAWPARIEGTSVNAAISSDTMAVPFGAERPVLAHKFLNFMLDEANALLNFEWLGYQPPQKGIDADLLIADEWVPDFLAEGIVREEDFELDTAWVQGQLDIATETLWSDQWNRVKSGG
jgi:spermidine/putrescine transport system substrate-binding protein